jgi:hypothetical protein
MGAFSAGCSPSPPEPTIEELRVCKERLSSKTRDLEVCLQEAGHLKQWRAEMEESLFKDSPPDVQKELERQKTELATLPVEVRIQVEEKLDSFYALMIKELKEQKRRHDDLLGELGRAFRQSTKTQEKVEKTQEKVDQVAAGATEIQQDLATLKRQDEEETTKAERRQRLAAEAHHIVEKVAGFDRRIKCGNCPDKIGMLKANRETLKFHSDLMKDLSALQTSLESP